MHKFCEITRPKHTKTMELSFTWHRTAQCQHSRVNISIAPYLLHRFIKCRGTPHVCLACAAHNNVWNRLPWNYGNVVVKLEPKWLIVRNIFGSIDSDNLFASEPYKLVLVRSIGGSSYCSYRRRWRALEPPLQLAEFGENVNKATLSIIRHVFCLAYVFPTWDPIKIAR